MKSFDVDVSVLCVFFVRPDHFEKTFAQVRKARPSRLFLYQDGPREGHPEDAANIEKCRQIAENIDWDCQVFRNYQEKNVGCDPSMFNAIKWMFSHTDKGIILEDDIVASVSFFRFCKELLDRYEKDTRIFKISGMNYLTQYNEDYADYFFSERTCLWGWATWKRVIDLLDEDYSFLDSVYAKDKLRKQIKAFDEKMATCVWHKNSGKKYFESILWNTRAVNHMVDIMPSRCQTSNIGVGADGTHGASSLKALPKGIQPLFFKETFELEFPLRHPPYVIADPDYNEAVYRYLGEGYPWVRFWRGIEGGWKSFYYADPQKRREKLKRIPQVVKNIFSTLKR